MCNAHVSDPDLMFLHATFMVIFKFPATINALGKDPWLQPLLVAALTSLARFDP